MSFIDSDSFGPTDSSMRLDTLDLQVYPPRDAPVEEVVSMVAAIYMYIIAVHIRFQQLGLQEYFINRPYHRIAYSLIIPLTSLLGIRHPVINLLRYVYYTFTFLFHLVRDRRFANPPVENSENQEVFVDTVLAPADGDQAVDVYHDSLE